MAALLARGEVVEVDLPLAMEWGWTGYTPGVIVAEVLAMARSGGECRPCVEWVEYVGPD